MPRSYRAGIDPAPQTFLHRVHVRLGERTHAELRDLAAELERTLADLLREAVRDLIRKYRGPT